MPCLIQFTQKVSDICQRSLNGTPFTTPGLPLEKEWVVAFLRLRSSWCHDEVCSFTRKLSLLAGSPHIGHMANCTSWPQIGGGTLCSWRIVDLLAGSRHHRHSWTRAHPGLGPGITCLNSLYRKARHDVQPMGNKSDSLKLDFSNLAIPWIFWATYELQYL